MNLGRLTLIADPVDVIMLYAYRYKIDLRFRHALLVIGTYAYHFWMTAMTPLRRVSGNQHAVLYSAGVASVVERGQRGSYTSAPHPGVHDNRLRNE